MRPARPVWRLVCVVLPLLGACSSRELPAPAPSARLVLITIDTLRPDVLGAYGGNPSPSPTLDALALESLVFENAYATAPRTGPSVGSILTSSAPSAHQILFTGDQPDTLRGRTLAEQLRLAGFTTAAFVGAPPLRARHGFDRGFDHYRQIVDNDHGDLGADARSLTQVAMRWVEQHDDERFFLWVHYYDPHLPYCVGAATRRAGGDAPEKIDIATAAKMVPASIEALREGYRADIFEVDVQLQRLLKTIGRGNHGRDTVIAVTADHAEYLGEHGLVHHLLLYEEVLRVPLLLQGPGIEPGRRADVVSLVDLAPTLLHILGVDPLPHAQGRSVLRAPRREAPVFAEWRDPNVFRGKQEPAASCFQLSVRQSGEKLIQDLLFDDESLFYDLKTDPGELSNLWRAEDARVKRLRARLEEHVQKDMPEGPGGLDAIATSPEEMELLRSLGYVN